MERDFLGLNSKEEQQQHQHQQQQVVVVKEEIIEGTRDSGYTKCSGMQWPFLYKAPANPHFMSFKASQEDKPKKVGSDVSSGFMPKSTADAFDSSQKRTTGEIQKSFNHDRQGGTHFSVKAYPIQPEAHAIHRPHDFNMFPVSNISLSMNNPFFKTHFAATGQNLAGATVKEQLVGGIPVTTASPTLPSTGSIAGFTELSRNNKASVSPAQLTIFYGGAVNVYDDITPEKAQAIMFLAGNGCPMASNAAHQRSQFQAPSSKPATNDGVIVNQPMNALPSSGLSSPLSVSSQTGAQSGSGSTSTEELMQAKTTGVSVTPVSRVDPPRMVNSLRPNTTATMFPSAVPQARKASLARFLEKRKERVMNSAAPYDLTKKSPECLVP